MHYTSIDNIHKVIDPLFLNELQEELEEIKNVKQVNVQKEKAKIYQNKLANLTFLDPACGSGNFLTETYLSLRHLENEALKLIHGNQIQLDLDQNIIKVSLNQFYGIEINDFAVSVAKTALWIAESQMLEETRSIVTFEESFLPLKTYTNIVEANALTIDWEDVVPKGRLNYIIGNPPFLGYDYQSKEQQQFLRDIFVDPDGKKYTSFGKIDLVSGWFLKAARFIDDTSIRVSFISTNSIIQGSSVPAIWKPIIEDYHCHIDFAYSSFKWESDATDKAQVHVVIIGFSTVNDLKAKYIFNQTEKKRVHNISPYLIDGSTIFIKNRTKPISMVDPMIKGSQPTDAGFLTKFDKKKIKSITDKYPEAQPLFHRLVGSTEFINNKDRYCLWLYQKNPSIYRNIPPIMEAVNNVKNMRLDSKDKATRQAVKYPYLFQRIRQPETDYLLVPSVSSGQRQYVPIGYMSKEVIANNLVFTVANASLYTFGILTSSTHNAWMRTVAGRLGTSYRYSNTIVYNNFPWPEVDGKQKEKIEKAAQAILDARALYPESSLADLYDELTMPKELRKAHEANDKAVLEAYGLSKNSSEDEIVAHLFNLYEKLVKEEK